MEHIEKYSADIVITDWLMPELEGLDVCRALKSNRETASIPIFMISCKSDEIDIVTALEIGADDFLTKPFRVKELIVKVKKTLKKLGSPEEESRHIIIRNNLQIDPESYTTYINNEKLSLTNYEFKILHLLAQKPGRVFSRHEIIDLINGEDNDCIVTLRSVDVQIVGLRRKMGKYKNYIETIRSVGYKFVLQE
ncbi:MAG: response regulator transcription factor [Bacteroidales bacterium]|nr:response regulator transcription factor [Bacteroidales bacterium]